MNERIKIDSLEVLRCFAFLGVFCSHTGIDFFGCTGKWGVEVFLILSGFLMTYNYLGCSKLDTVSVKENTKFVMCEIKRLYPLHIIVLLFFLTTDLIGNEKTKINLTSYVLNALLIQEWVPIKGIESISVSWYLCTLAFSYFLFPYINRDMEKKYNKRKAYTLLTISCIIQLLIGLLGNSLKKVDIMWLQSDLSVWLIYKWPMSRIWDFIIGCNLAYIFMHKEYKANKRKWSMLELIAICLAVISNIISKNIDCILKNNCWNYVVIFTFTSIFLIYIFAIGKGEITKLLTIKPILFIAKVSPFAFLIVTALFRGIKKPQLSL